MRILFAGGAVASSSLGTSSESLLVGARALANMVPSILESARIEDRLSDAHALSTVAS